MDKVVSIIGIDISKSCLHLHGATACLNHTRSDAGLSPPRGSTEGREDVPRGLDCSASAWPLTQP